MKIRKHGAPRIRRAGSALLGLALATTTVALGAPVAPAGAAVAPEDCFKALKLGASATSVPGEIIEMVSTPDGNKVAYLQATGTPETTFTYSVHHVDTATGTTERIDVTPSGGVPNGMATTGLTISSDGRFVMFVSQASDLVEGDTNADLDVFVRDVTDNTTDRVSVGVDAASGGSGWGPAMSADGRYVLFTSKAGLHADDEDDDWDAYLRDREAGTTTLVPQLPSAFGVTEAFAITPDGDFALYGSVTESSAAVELYRWDIEAGTIALVSEHPAETHSVNRFPRPAISDDGRYAAFAATHVYVEGDDPVMPHLYRRDMDSTEYVNMSPEHMPNLWIVRNPVPPTGAPRSFGNGIWLSADGTRIGYPSFDSRAQVFHHVIYDEGGRSRLLLDQTGLPVDSEYVAMTDGGEVAVYALNKGVSPNRTAELQQSAIDRASVTRYSVAGPSEDGITELLYGTTTSVDLHGWNLGADTTFDFGAGVTVGNYDAATSPATAELTVADPVTGGVRQPVVKSVSGCNTTGAGILVTDGKPVVNGLSLARLRPGETVETTISGRFLACPCEITASDGIEIGAVVSSTDSSITVPVTAPAFTEDALADLTIVNAEGKSSTATAFRLHTSEGEYTAVLPARILDTRFGVGGPKTKVGQTARSVQVAGAGGVPVSSDATAVVMNVTVVSPSVGGYLTVWPAGTAQPLVSSLNFVAGQVVPNQVTVPLSAAGAVDVFVSNGAADVIFDVVGFYSSKAGPVGGRFVPTVGQRLLDTRMTGQPFNPGEVRTLASPAFEPGSSVAVLNVTVVGPSASGWLTLAPKGPVPVASNLNFVPGQTVANVVTVGLSSDLAISIYNATGQAHVIIDLVALYSDTTSIRSDAAFRPLEPARFLDTRLGFGATRGPLGGGKSLSLTVAGRIGVPLQASAVAGNITVATPTAGGYLTVWPSGTTQPGTSNLNFLRGQTVPNALVTKLGSNGSLSVFNSAGQTEVILDIAGWFTPEALGTS